MNPLIKITFILCFGLLVYSGKSQVLPPDLICTQSDSLFWELPVNTCGPFNAYLVYFSADINGPYSLLATITDPMQVNLFHPNPTGQQWFYYMESDYNCPGQTVLSSDTLDNRSPEVAPIEGVSVEGNNVRIDWMLSPSPEVFAYIVYKNTPSGTLPIDTVYGDISTYLDVAANPKTQIETYYIVSLDRCDNTSIFDDPHSTINLAATVDPCQQNISLSWNLYQNWPMGIGSQEVWMAIDGLAPEKIATLGPTDTTFVFEDALKIHFYSFFIQTIADGSNRFSASNILSLQPRIVQSVRELLITNVSVTEDNEVDIYWTWNTDAEIRQLNFLSAPQNSDYQSVGVQNPANPLQADNRFTEPSTNPSGSSVFYRLQTSDLCDTLFQSNTASTIFLSGSPLENLNNQLNWTAYNVEGGRVLNYELYRIVEGQESLVETIDGNLTTHLDPVDPYEQAESNVCYYLIANAEYELPDGSIQQFRSRSNEICVQQLTTILVPNAFAPSGINTRFKPVLVFSENVNYKMVILDRWGGKLFETTDIDEGWTGRKGLVQVPMGAYTYVIRVVQPDGRVIEKNGVVVLVR